jgi:hypothetical protein
VSTRRTSEFVGRSTVGWGPSSAAAVAFVDHYKRNFSNLIDNPGLLFANLLLMGDRAALVGGATTKIWTGFDSTFGGGRIKMRRFDDVGMGSPWGYLTGVECITAGETLQYHFTTSGQLPAGVDTVKFVTWWYDRRHELSDQNSIANIDLELWEIDAMGNKLVKLAESKSSTDDKERIVAVDPNLGGKYLLLEIQGVDGFDLNFDYGGCRLNGWITLYTAFYYESSDRNVDPEGPEWAQTADTWVGVEPESWSWP